MSRRKQASGRTAGVLREQSNRPRIQVGLSLAEGKQQKSCHDPLLPYNQSPRFGPRVVIRLAGLQSERRYRIASQSMTPAQAEEVCGNDCADGIAAAVPSFLPSCALSSNIRWPAKENREKQRGVYVGHSPFVWGFVLLCHIRRLRTAISLHYGHYASLSYYYPREEARERALKNVSSITSI